MTGSPYLLPCYQRTRPFSVHSLPFYSASESVCVLAKQRPDLAFAHYEEAWEAAQAALGVVLAASAPAEAAAAADHLHDDLEDDSNADETTVVQHLFLPLITR